MGAARLWPPTQHPGRSIMDWTRATDAAFSIPTNQLEYSVPEGPEILAGGRGSLGDRTPPVGDDFGISSSRARTQGASRFIGSQKCAGRISSPSGVGAARCCDPSHPATSWVCFLRSLHATGGVRSLSSLDPRLISGVPLGRKASIKSSLWYHSTTNVPFITRQWPGKVQR